MNEFKLGNRMVGYQHPPLVIAEIGINHNGSLDSAISLADDAIDAGIEVIKHQTHVVEDEMTLEAKSVIPGNSDKSIYQIMEECALNEEDEVSLKEHVESRGKIFISTPFSRAAADRLERMGVCGYKIGSGECNNYPLIEHIASFKKPIILSTGMNDLESIRPAVKILRKHQIPYALLHTTNIYPTPDRLVRLGAMNELQDTFSDAVVGLSDHTVSNHACFGAVALGASILERHFTDSMTREGPDIINSMDPLAAQELIIGANTIYEQRGGSKGAVDEELPTIKFAFASVVSINDIKKGDTFSKDNLWVKRPGTGEILADEFEYILNKKAKNDILSGQQLKREDIQ
ncbi:N-acetylneuraminate synthase family protein [Gammaproteobacteria bacterium]|nr:N-acetylneuraminate synthase family protein [Gammaproteobacteria bacterium]